MGLIDAVILERPRELGEILHDVHTGQLGDVHPDETFTFVTPTAEIEFERLRDELSLC